MASLEWDTSLDVVLVRALGEPLVEREEGNKGANSDASMDQLSLLESWEHLERSLGVRVTLVHVFSKLKIKESHLVIGKMRGKFHMDTLTSVQASPLWVMLLSLAEFSDVLDEGLTLLEAIKFKGLSERIKVS